MDSSLEKEKYVEFLNNDLETKDFVDTGDIKYFRNNKNEKPSSKVIWRTNFNLTNIGEKIIYIFFYDTHQILTSNRWI